MSNRTYTDSQIVEWNEDGSRTVTTVETIHPVTKKQQAAAWATLGGLALLPVVPIVAFAVAEKIEEKREARRQKKLANKAEPK